MSIRYVFNPQVCLRRSPLGAPVTMCLFVMPHT